MIQNSQSRSRMANASQCKPEPAPTIDLLRMPVLGRFLRWRGSRLALQLPVLALSLLMIAHAFWGPQLAPKNLATLLTWVHFRGLVVFVILIAGNLFCMACPFMLPRELARRFHWPRWTWPRRLRNKWTATILFVLVLFVYELMDLWGDPWWTGVLIVSYFLAALMIDALFRRASFCKYVCPIGQFNFLSSTMAPLEVAVRDQSVCTNCTTKDCIRGRRDQQSHDASKLSNSNDRQGARKQHETEALPIVQRGCELALFQPRKVGNLDCTFCLDCVYACPHDNVGLMTRLPGEELTEGGSRSGIGNVEGRFDFTVLAAVFTFGALLNAFAMISPVYAIEKWIAAATGLRVEWPILASLFLVGLVVEPAILLGGAALASRRYADRPKSVFATINHFARSLVPIGFGVWLAHYGFHFLTGMFTVIPIAQNAAIQSFGWPLIGEPQWQLGGLPESIVFPIEVGLMSLGLLGSLMVSWSLATDLSSRRAGRCFAPWAVLHWLLFVSAVWIMTQPMDMRGTFLGA